MRREFVVECSPGIMVIVEVTGQLGYEALM